MQTRAVIKAAIAVNKRKGWNMVPEIMIPLVGEVKELKYVKDVVVKTADAVIAELGADLKYIVGTMIEIPRAALTADAIAKEAAFFSFGTNDLTQMTFGFSRDDAGKFLKSYYEHKIYESDPFARVDQIGVGQLVDMACKAGRATRPELHLGVCGEHGGDPSSVEFFHKVGLDYVSCSPFRVPIARLAAAQAAIKEEEAKAAEGKAEENAVKAELNAKIEAAKAVLKEAAEKAELGEKVDAAKAVLKDAADKAELNDKVEAAKAALKDVTDKFQAIAADKTDDLMDVAAAAFKSLKAGWEEAKKTFGQEKK
jgi:signal transduction protein with GAF and PtsI domain